MTLERRTLFNSSPGASADRFHALLFSILPRPGVERLAPGATAMRPNARIPSAAQSACSLRAGILSVRAIFLYVLVQMR